MQVALGVSHKDSDLARALLLRMKELDGRTEHSILIVAGAKTDTDQLNELASIAAETCSSVNMIRLRTEADRGWPNACNQMFQAGAEWIQSKSVPFWLWLEPDVVPLTPGWLDTIAHEYQVARKPFFGTLYEQPFKHLNGVMVYPGNVRAHNPWMLAATNIPWDLTRPDVTLRLGFDSPLFQRSLADPKNNRCHSFPTADALALLTGKSVMFHGCRDGSLTARLKDKERAIVMLENDLALPMPDGDEFAPVRVIRKVKALLKGYSDFFHSGNLGDVLYGLFAVKKHGGGRLLIGPEQKQTAKCTVPITNSQFDMLAPLLRVQPYIKSTEWVPRYPSGKLFHDLNHFRNHWVNGVMRKKFGIDTLCKCHFLELGILHKYDDNEPWLTVPDPINTGRIIVHRSPRYNSPTIGDKAFPWKRLIAEHGSEMLFVGLDSEWEKFQSEFKCKVSFWKVKDFLELGRVVAGGKAFFGNQSFALSIALGVGQRVLAEACPASPDCRFKRQNYDDQLITPPDLISLNGWMDE